jgi:hypothetical protein
MNLARDANALRVSLQPGKGPSLKKRRSGVAVSVAVTPPAIKTRRSLEAPAKTQTSTTSSSPSPTPTNATRQTEFALAAERCATVSPPPADLPSSTKPKGNASRKRASDEFEQPSLGSLPPKLKDAGTSSPKAATVKRDNLKNKSGVRPESSPSRQSSGSGRPPKRSRTQHVHFNDGPDESSGALASDSPIANSPPAATGTAFAKHAAVLRAVPNAIEFMLTRIRNLEAEVTALKTREANVTANAHRSEQLVAEQLEKFTSSFAALTGELKNTVRVEAVLNHTPPNPSAM